MLLSLILVRSSDSSLRDDIWANTADPASVSLVPARESICRFLAAVNANIASSVTNKNPVKSRCVNGNATRMNGEKIA